MNDFAEKTQNVDAAGQGNVEEPYDSTSMIFGVVIGILHGSGNLTNKQLIKQELAKWLPTAADRELKCYTMCIWFTAQCLTQQQSSTKLTSETASTTSTFTQTVDCIQTVNHQFVEISQRPENVGEVTTSVGADVAVEQTGDCNPQISAVGVIIGTTFFAAKAEILDAADHHGYLPETLGYSCEGLANCIKTEHNDDVTPAPVTAETERLDISDNRADYKVEDNLHAPLKRLRYSPENSNIARIVTSEILTDGADNATKELDEPSPRNQVCDEGAVLREDYPLATLLECSRDISHTEQFYTELDTNECVNDAEEEKPHKCAVCGSSFNSSLTLHSHMFKHKNRQLAGPIAEQCKICGIWFGLTDSLRAHLKLRHDAEENLYQCCTCGLSFSQLNRLEIHKIIHADGGKPRKTKIRRRLSIPAEYDLRERPYKCEFCDKSCLRAADLKMHMRRHTGEKPFKCDLCGAAFSMSGNLRKHVRRHTGEKPFSCNVCGLAFSRSTLLRRHERKHLQKRYRCDACGVEFDEVYCRRRHECKKTGKEPLKSSTAAGANVNIIGEVVCVGMGFVVKNDSEISTVQAIN